MEVSIKKLEPKLLDDFLYLFDKLAFSDNPDWSGCYCQFYRCREEQWDMRTAESNRFMSAQMISGGTMNGFLAYADTKPVAWCHADDREKLTRVGDFYTGSDFALKVGSVVCFVVAPEYRRQGFAKKLLEYAAEDFENRGYAALDAYPRLDGKTEAEHYHGPLQMYLNQGFVKQGEFGSFALVRKKLTMGSG